MRHLIVAAMLVLGVSGCAGGQEDSEPDAADSGQRFPDVVDASVSCDDDTCTVEATISSPYDSTERYADAFRVSTTDGDVLGERELTHDHAEEQPFTRSLTGVEIPAAVDEVVVEGHDLEHGWGGKTVSVPVER